MDKEKQPGAYRIAVATTDGTYIDQCFGHAEHFLILEVQENGQFLVLEDRKADPFCMGGYHLDPALEKAGDGISDCTYILAARAGEPAALAMQEKGITLLRCPGTIEDGVLAVQQHKKTLDNGFALV